MGNEATDFQVIGGESNVSVDFPDWFVAAAPKDANWEVKLLSNSCLILRSRSSASPLSGDPSALMKVPADLLKDMFEGLIDRKWSGVLGIDAGLGQQKVYFAEGELNFASSTLMDHRLGEVIYRNGKISLEQLTESAVKVTRSTKFGQVLLKGGGFTTVDLWGALRLQILQILRTIFLAPTVYIEVKEGRNLAPTSVIFAERSKQVVRDAYYFGCMFRDFMGHIKFDNKIEIKESQLQDYDFQEGTFLKDLIDLVKEHHEVSKVIEASKLHEVNTMVSIMDLVNRGICELDSIRGVDGVAKTSVHPELQSKLDAYSFLVRKTKAVFDELKLPFPIKDLRRFSLNLNPNEFISLYLNDEGDVHKESVYWMSCQCINNEERAVYFSCRIESLIQFLLQASGDLLPYEKSKALKDQFKQLRA